MPRIALTDARVRALKRRKTTYDIRDGKLRGFGIRVLPSGAKRYFIHSQHRGRRVWKIVGEVGSIGADEARARAKSLLAAIREGSDERGRGITGHRVRDDRRRGLSALRPQLETLDPQGQPELLPQADSALVQGTPDRRHHCHDVRRWFASLHNTPVAADRSVPVLSVIMRQAEVYGYRPEGTNPCAGIKRYRREGRERFLSAAETRSLAAVLDRFEADRPQQVAIIRLLLLTGCRASEVRTLKWRYRREGKLFLPDSKTGPRTIWLSSAAHAILDRVPRTASWMFPSPRTNGPLSHNGLDETWRRIREEADLRDVRLHDLRHSYASTALQHGETVLTIGRLLGHGHPTTTLKYMHWADATVREAVEAVGTVLEG